MQMYMRALEWSVSYRKESVNKYEDALRNAYTDAICEQVLSGKYVVDKKTNRKTWLSTQVPLRLSDVHLFAAFLIPENNNLKFNSTMDVLYNAGQSNGKSFKNKMKAISKQLKLHSEQW